MNQCLRDVYLLAIFAAITSEGSLTETLASNIAFLTVGALCVGTFRALDWIFSRAEGGEEDQAL